MNEADWIKAGLTANWQHEVANGDTLLGFAEWCERRKEEDALDG